MKKKIFLKITIVMLLLIWVYSTIVNALSFTVTMTPSASVVPESTEFIVTIKVTNIEIGDENGISSLTGYLEYDSDIFEKITESSIEGMNSWTPKYEEDGDNRGKISLSKSTFVESEENVFNVTFKTKSDTNGEVGKIQFTNIVASNSANDTTASDISISVEVGNSGSSGNTANNAVISADLPSNNTSNNTSNETNNNVVNNIVPSYVNEAANSSEEDIPYTGVGNVVVYAIGIILVVAIVFYIKFQKINKDIK